MATKAQFDLAAEKLLGTEKYSSLLKSGFSRPDFCREIAMDSFAGRLVEYPNMAHDIEIVRAVAKRLWDGDGCTGLED